MKAFRPNSFLSAFLLLFGISQTTAQDFTLSNTAIPHNQPSGTLVGTLTYPSPTEPIIDPANVGTELWDFTDAGQFSSSPSLHSDGRIFVGSTLGDGKLYCLNPVDGLTLWEFDAGADIWSTPMLSTSGRLFVTSDDGKLNALNADTGAKQWEFVADSAIYASPAIGQNGAVYIASELETLYAINSQTGELIWELEEVGGDFSSPVIGADGTVLVGSINGLTAVNGTTGSVKWTFEDGGMVIGSAAIGANGLVYFGTSDNGIYGLNILNGQMVWEFDAGSSVEASPAIGENGNVYIGASDGTVYALNGETGEKLWDYATGGEIFGSPAVGSDNTVYIGSFDNKLHAIDGNDGQLLWDFTTGDSIEGGPVIGPGGVIYLPSQDQHLYAIQGSSLPANSNWPMFGGKAFNSRTCCSFSLVSGEGSTHNPLFQIQGNRLEIAHSLDILNRSEFYVRIQGNDDGNLTEQALILVIQAFAPTAIHLSSNTILEQRGEGVTIGTLSATDPDIGDSHTFSLDELSSYPDNAAFKILGNELQSNQTFDFATRSSWTVQVVATDSYGESFSQSLDIEIEEDTADPSDIQIDNNMVPDNTPAGYIVGNLSLPGPSDPIIDPGQIGQKLWEFTAGGSVSGSPSLGQDGTVYFTAEDSTLYALDGRNGTLKWQFNNENNAAFPPAIADDGTVFFGHDSGQLHALNPTTGASSWSDDAFGAVYNSPAIGANNLVLIGADDFSINAYDGSTGDFLWFIPTLGNVTATPAIGSNNRAYVGGDDNLFYAIDISTEEVVWEFQTGGPILSSAAIGGDGTIYVGSSDNSVYALHPATGTPIWEFVTGDAVISSPIIGLDGAIYIGSSDGNVYALDGDTGELVWEHSTGGAVESSAVIGDDGILYIGSSDGNLYAINSEDGGLEWEFSTGGAITSAPVIGPNAEVYFGSADNKLYALQGSALLANSSWPTLGGTVQRSGQSQATVFNLIAGDGDTDNSFFRIEGNQLKLDFPVYLLNRSRYNIRVQAIASDGTTTEGTIALVQITDNVAPSQVLLSTNSLVENSPGGTLIGTLTAQDDDQDDIHTFQFTNYAEYPANGLFNIDGNNLESVIPLNFESISQYEVAIEVTDNGGLTHTEILNINVTDTNDPPSGYTLDNATIQENQAIGTVIGNLIAADPDTTDTHTYTFVQNDIYPDNALFTIDGTELQSGASYDFESKSSFSLCIQVSDSGDLHFSKNLTVTILDINDAPTNFTLDSNEVEENFPILIPVGTLSAVDQDAVDSFSYTLVQEDIYPDNLQFAISGDQLLTGDVFNFEAKDEYSICIQVEDSGGLTFSQNITVNITDGNDAPTGYNLDLTSIAENQPINTTVGTLSGVDPDAGNTFTYALVNDGLYPDNVRFFIDGDELKTATIFNFETKAAYTICIEVTDQSGASFNQNILITISDINDPPTDYTISSLEVPENSPIGTTVGTIFVDDPDAVDNYTFALVQDGIYPDNSAFTFDGSNLITTRIFDFEDKASYTICLQVTDSGGLVFSENRTIQVDDTNDSPTGFFIDSSSIAENQAPGALVGNFTSSDPDTGDTHTYSLVDPGTYPDNAAFTMDGNQLKSAQIFKFATKSIYTICVQTRDEGGLTFQDNLTVQVTNVVEAPTAITMDNQTIPENSPSGTTIGNLTAIDPDIGDSHVFSLINPGLYPDNAAFFVDGGELKSSQVFDFENKSRYEICLQTTDSVGLTFIRNLILTVEDVNEAPNVLTLDKNSVDEIAPTGTTIGAFATVDPDAGDSHTYALINNGLYPGNAAFDIEGNELKTAQAINFEAVNTYEICVQVTDNQGLSFDKVFSVTVEDANELPTAILLDNSSILENGTADEVVGTLSVVDQDQGSTHILELLPSDQNADNAAFTLDGTQLKVVAPLDFESQSRYSVLIRATDNGGLQLDYAVEVQVLDVNEPPSGVSLPDNQVDENQPSGTIVGILQESPLDTADTHTFSLINPSQYPDNQFFSIFGEELRTNATFNFESRNTYTVCVEVTDAGGSTASGPLTIEVQNLNETPLAFNLDNVIISENLPADTTVGSFTTFDTDFDDTFTYELIDTGNYPDNTNFAISGNLLTAKLLNFEAQSSHNILVRVTDSGGLSIEQNFSIGVSDASEPPTQIGIDSDSILETSNFGTIVGILSHGDPDAGDTHTFTLINPQLYPDNTSFLVVGNQLRSNAPFDFETKTVFTICMQVSDSTGHQINAPLRINILDTNEPPTSLSVDNTTIPELIAPGTLVAGLATTDPDNGDTHTFALSDVSQTPDNSAFTIVNDQLFVNQGFDFETKNIYSIDIVVTDFGGLQFSKNVTIDITDSEEPPVGIELTDYEIAMNQPDGTAIAQLSLIDPDQNPPPPGTFPPPVYNFVAGFGSQDNLLFRIHNDELQIGDPESILGRSTFNVRVQANTHEGVVLQQHFTLTTRPFPVTHIALSKNVIQENEPIGTTIGYLSAYDRDFEDPHTFALVNSVKYPDNNAFYIEQNMLMAAKSFDFEEQSEFMIYIQATDSFGLTYSQPMYVHVFNQNEHATSMYMDDQLVAQFDPIGTVVGTFLFNDPDTEFSPQVEGQEGEIFWTKSTGGPVNSSPAIGINGYIYIGSSDNHFYALDDDTGHAIWSYKTQGQIVASPAVGPDNTVYVGSWDNHLYSFNGFSGLKNWSFKTGSRISSSPAIGVDGTVYFGSADKYLYALNGDTGSMKWKFATGGEISGAPALGEEGRIYFGSHDRKFYALDAETGELEWAFQTGGWVRSTPAFGADGKIYVGSDDNSLYALNSQTGEIIWSFHAGYHIAASPIISDLGIVFVASSDNKVYALDEVTGQQMWEHVTNDSLLASPVISGDGTLYVASLDQHLYALNGQTGALLWSVLLDGQAVSSPVIDSNGTLYFGTRAGTIYAIGGNSGSTDFAWPMRGGNSQRTGRNFSRFTLVEGTGSLDNRHFEIEGNELKLRETLDHLEKTNFTIRVRGVASSGIAFEEPFTISQFVEGASPLSLHATSLGGMGWMNLDWFGNFMDRKDGWIFNESLGWLYSERDLDLEGYWLWDEEMGWLWTDEGVYPNFYRNDHGWITYHEGSTEPRFFYDWASETWLQR